MFASRYIPDACLLSMQMDDVMGQAQAVATNLRGQRQLFSNIGDKLLSVAAKYPAVNGLLNAIRRKKSMVSRGVASDCCSR